jgi:hypothetical protein
MRKGSIGLFFAERCRRVRCTMRQRPRAVGEGFAAQSLPQDRMIKPDLERFMAKRAQSQVIELPSSHAVFLADARVAALIEKAATAGKWVHRVPMSASNRLCCKSRRPRS